MTKIRFMTREIGSLDKPGWHVKAMSSRPSRIKVAEEVREWARRLGIGSGELAEILRIREGFTNEQRRRRYRTSRLPTPYGSCNARVWTQVTTASNAAAKCTMAWSGTRGAARLAAPSAPSTTSTTPRPPSKSLLQSLRSGRVRVRPVAHGSRRQDPLHQRLHHRGLVLRWGLHQRHHARCRRTTSRSAAAVRQSQRRLVTV
jgi:hypothetical protein